MENLASLQSRACPRGPCSHPQSIAYAGGMSQDKPADAPKLIIDSDWKSQAQAEKERLVAKQAEAPAKPAKAKGKAKGPSLAGGPAAGPGGEEMELPEADFSTLVSSMVSQALMYMGAFPDPQTGKALVSLEYARFHIDLLAVLEEKTKGNITAEESSELQAVVRELQTRYLQIGEAVAKIVAERMSHGGGMPGGSLGGGLVGGEGPLGAIGPGGLKF